MSVYMQMRRVELSLHIMPGFIFIGLQDTRENFNFQSKHEVVTIYCLILPFEPPQPEKQTYVPKIESLANIRIVIFLYLNTVK